MRVNIHPIKLGVDHCYIIQGEGTIMIDAGSPGQATRFRKAMDGLGIDPRSIRLSCSPTATGIISDQPETSRRSRGPRSPCTSEKRIGWKRP